MKINSLLQFFHYMYEKNMQPTHGQIIQEWNKKDRIQKYAVGSSNLKPKVKCDFKKLEAW